MIGIETEGFNANPQKPVGIDIWTKLKEKIEVAMGPLTRPPCGEKLHITMCKEQRYQR